MESASETLGRVKSLKEGHERLLLISQEQRKVSIKTQTPTRRKATPHQATPQVTKLPHDQKRTKAVGGVTPVLKVEKPNNPGRALAQRLQFSNEIAPIAPRDLDASRDVINEVDGILLELNSRCTQVRDHDQANEAFKEDIVAKLKATIETFKAQNAASIATVEAKKKLQLKLIATEASLAVLRRAFEKQEDAFRSRATTEEHLRARIDVVESNNRELRRKCNQLLLREQEAKNMAISIAKLKDNWAKAVTAKKKAQCDLDGLKRRMRYEYNADISDDEDRGDSEEEEEYDADKIQEPPNKKRKWFNLFG